MTVAQLFDLHQQIVSVLEEAGKPLRTPEIEVYLKVRGNWSADTFDVRDAVRELEASGLVEFVHPGYLVKLTGKK